MAGKKTRDKGEAAQEKAAEPKKRTVVVPRLQERYRQQVLPALQEKLGRDQSHVVAAFGEDRGQHGRGCRDAG